MATNSEFERGAEWRQWDLHIHTPASFHWLGKRFEVDPNSIENTTLVDEMILALKKRQIEEHSSINNKPAPIPKPSEQLSSEQQQAASSLDEITVKLKGLEEEAVANASAQERTLIMRLL